MKQRLLLFITLFSFLASTAQVNPPRNEHYLVPCATGLTDSACNLIANPGFRSTGDSLEDFSDGEVIMWQDINNLTTDINGALATTMGWNLPTVPSALTGVNFASMLVDNRHLLTEGIAGKIFQLVSGKKYALSFFLSSSALSNYRPYGAYTFKIFLANCQNFDTTSSGNPEIIGESQLIFCQSFGFKGDSDWQQYLVSFTADDDYNMIVIYPELSSSSYNGGTYVHFLYPELIPINPTNQYLTYTVPPDSTQGITLLSACGVTNASYQWEGPNGIVSDQVSNVIAYSPSIGGNDAYTFSMWVEGAMGNDPELCWDANAPTITETSLQLPTTERVTCSDPVTATNTCNIIPNAIFEKKPASASNLDAFRQDRVEFWSSVNGATPDLNGLGIAPPRPALPANVPPTANAAGMVIGTPSSGYYYEGIYAKIPHLTAGNKYAFSFFLHTIRIMGAPAVNFTFRVVLSNCKQFPTQDGVGTIVPPDIDNPSQDILCQNFPGVVSTGWQQYLVTFTAEEDFDMIVIYPERNVVSTGLNYIYFLYPELIDVTSLITYTANSACSYTLQACGVTNATYQWVDGDNNIIGNTNQITVDATINPPLYTLTLSVPNILNNPILNNSCSNNTGTIRALAFGNETTWTGASSIDWSIAANWNPAVVPNDALTDVFIPTGAMNQPTIMSGTFQVNSIVIESGGLLTNKGTLQIARNIIGNSGSISNYDGSIVTGSIEMNGTCKAQTLAGNVFVGNDVKNFTAANNVTISSASGEGLDVWGELGFCSPGTVPCTAINKTLITGGNLTLVSTASTTANVAKIEDVSNFISGDVTVERHILTGLGGGEHAKTWQALATPTGANSIGQSVYDSWQEGGNNNSTGYGTHIPDPNWTSTNGFDYNVATQTIPSIKTYNSGNNNFDPIVNTSIPLYNKNGYFLFVRGDRIKTLLGDLPNPTNMRSKGALFQPHTGYTPPSVTVVGGGKFELIGNPYASAIDIEYMRTHGKFSNLTNNVIVWDPLIPGTQGLGGYQVLTASSTPPYYTPTPGGTLGNTHYVSGVSYTEIQSGQAFFMKTSGSSNGSVTFDESVKTSNSRVVTRGANASSVKSFRASLFSGTGICDGNAIMYDYSFTNDIDLNDAERPFNPGENFMIRKENNTFLTVETKGIIKYADSIFYTFKNLRKIKYQLVFAVENLHEEGLNAILIDNYLQQKIPLSLTDSSFIYFMVDDNKTSYENRFMVVFNRDAQTDPLAAAKNKQLADRSFVVYPNPTENKTISIRFINQPLGIYKLQLINHAGQDVFNGNIKINDANCQTSVKPSRVATGSYQLVITSVDGRKFVQQVIIK